MTKPIMVICNKVNLQNSDCIGCKHSIKHQKIYDDDNDKLPCSAWTDCAAEEPSIKVRCVKVKKAK